MNALNSVQRIKAMSKVLKIHYMDVNALNTMYVKDVEDSVCGFYATLYTE